MESRDKRFGSITLAGDGVADTSAGTVTSQSANITLTCDTSSVTASGTKACKWYGPDGSEITENVADNVLTIAKYQDSLKGEYTCKVFNQESSLGLSETSIDATMTLSTVKIDQAALTVAKTGATDTTVTVGHTGGSGTGKVEYGRSTTDSTPAAWQAGGEFIGLNAETQYYFFAKQAEDADYKEAQSTGLSVTTTATPKVPQTVTLNPAAIDSGFYPGNTKEVTITTDAAGATDANCGTFDEDLFQELCLTCLRCVHTIRI